MTRACGCVRDVVLLLVLAMATSHCGTTGAEPTGSPAPLPAPLYVAHVPFHPQQAYQCGPASLAAVLNYFGHPATPDAIAQAVYVRELRGSLGLDMWRYALAQQFDAQMMRSSLAELTAHIRAQQPVVAFLNIGYDWFPVGHFVVVVGMDPARREVITYSGTKKDHRMSYDEFERAWSKTKHWALVVRPPTSAPRGAGTAI